MTTTPDTELPPKPADATPMMRQYNAIKQQNPGTLLLYRMGDFYEMFNEDAKIASRVLGLTLTSRNHGGVNETPLAGFPYHALDRYANRLVKAGHKIAICEQTEDPKTAKGIVKRDVVEVITAGTATDDAYIDEKSNNYIVSLFAADGKIGIAVCDLSTGEFVTEEVEPVALETELARIAPSETLIDDHDTANLAKNLEQVGVQTVITRYDSWKFAPDTAKTTLADHFGVVSLDGMGLEGYNAGISAAGALLSYVKEQKKNNLGHITSLSVRATAAYSELDPSTIRNLELLRPLHADETGGTLLSVLDKTSTAMGGRLLKRWIIHPLRNVAEINDRLSCVAWFKSDMYARGEIELALKQIADIERIIGRVMFERANARDLIGLGVSLGRFPQVIKSLASSPCQRIAALCKVLGGFEGVVGKILATIAENPPLSIREGGIIRSGVSPQLDELHDASRNGKEWIARLQETERVRTGIGSLKVGYNKVFGYYIEISKANMELAPADYQRKQTLTNGERFITPELKEMESKILGAEERLSGLEYEIFCALRRDIAAHCGRIQQAAQALSEIDLYVCFAKCAAEFSYVRPVLMDNTDLVIKDGRHPVVERMDPSDQFIPNDTELVSSKTQIMLITGPNMAGKSTYLRQTALIALMAQMGSFVPAAAAQIGIVDRFFTRVGASDRLARGQSTFLVEMIEVANILNNATDKSFVLLDEVGRGTSTFDGISIAWAVAEHLHESSGRRARTLFATHYHELTELALLLPRIKNFHVKVKEWNDKIVFLRKIDEGSCDHSYGIQVARLAGVPRAVIIRAKEILANLENMELTPDHKPVLARHHQARSAQEQQHEDLFSSGNQLNFMDAHTVEVTDQLRSLNIESLRPLDALNILAELKKKLTE